MNLGSDSPASSAERPIASANPVSTGPGQSAVTVTPCGRTSSATAWEYASTNALDPP